MRCHRETPTFERTSAAAGAAISDVERRTFVSRASIHASRSAGSYTTRVPKDRYAGPSPVTANLASVCLATRKPRLTRYSEASERDRNRVALASVATT